jgi:hypothetical protein
VALEMALVYTNDSDPSPAPTSAYDDKGRLHNYFLFVKQFYHVILRNGLEEG